MTFAEQVKTARAAAGMTQDELSFYAEIPKRLIEDWEDGISVPPEYVQFLVLEWLKSKAD